MRPLQSSKAQLEIRLHCDLVTQTLATPPDSLSHGLFICKVQSQVHLHSKPVQSIKPRGTALFCRQNKKRLLHLKAFWRWTVMIFVRFCNHTSCIMLAFKLTGGHLCSHSQGNSNKMPIILTQGSDRACAMPAWKLPSPPPLLHPQDHPHRCCSVSTPFTDFPFPHKDRASDTG